MCVLSLRMREFVCGCVCCCHVFTQCYELQPWHCFPPPYTLLRPRSSAAEVIWKEPWRPPTDLAALELDVRPIAFFLFVHRVKMIINRSFTPSPCDIPHFSDEVRLPFKLRDPWSSETLLTTWVSVLSCSLRAMSEFNIEQLAV